MSEKKYVRLILFTGLTSYFIADFIFKILIEPKVGKHIVLQLLFTVMVASMIGVLVNGVVNRKYREVMRVINIEEYDERGVMISSIANQYTLVIASFCGFGLFMVAVFVDVSLALLVGILYIAVFAFNLLFREYLKKRY